MVVSFIPGRIRLRLKELKKSPLAEYAKKRVKEIPGITAVEINPLTGSVLIEYDEKILPTEKLIEIGKQELAKFSPDLKLPPMLDSYSNSL